MFDEVVLIIETKEPYRARLRPGTATDRTALVKSWVPVLEVGPVEWPDREWPWHAFGAEELHVELNPEWLVIADEVEPSASGELFGVLVTTGPATTHQAGIDALLELDGALIWVEHIAIAPSLRPDCPVRHRRNPCVKVGPTLMKAAIARSEALGLDGRIGLHADGDGAREKYEKWAMICVGKAAHRVDGVYPVCFGDAGWAARFRAGKPTTTGGR